jgi:hypothetical protein
MSATFIEMCYTKQYTMLKLVLQLVSVARQMFLMLGLSPKFVPISTWVKDYQQVVVIAALNFCLLQKITEEKQQDPSGCHVG